MRRLSVTTLPPPVRVKIEYSLIMASDSELPLVVLLFTVLHKIFAKAIPYILDKVANVLFAIKAAY